MAQIYGEPGAEISLLKNCPNDIISFYQISQDLNKLNKKLKKLDQEFNNNLSKLIRIEDKKLKNLNVDLNNIKKIWNKKINNIRKDIKKNKKEFKLLLKLILNYLKLFQVKYFLKPSAITKIKNQIDDKKEYISNLRNDPQQIFRDENEDLILNINNYKKIKSSSDYFGAKGELKVLEKLKELNNNYHIFCDVNIDLGEYISHNYQYNLKSAQMDFVVVGNNGIFVIEVKNWSNETVFNHKQFTPHEQVDRAGHVLFVYLQNKFFRYKPKISKIIVSMQNNISYNLNYKYVFVKPPNNISNFIKHNNYNKLDEKKKTKIIKLLKKRVNK